MENEQEPVAGLAPKRKWAPRPPDDLTQCAMEQLAFLCEHTRAGFCVDECQLCGTLLAAREMLLNCHEVTEFTEARPKPRDWDDRGPITPAL